LPRDHQNRQELMGLMQADGRTLVQITAAALKRWQEADAHGVVGAYLSNRPTQRASGLIEADWRFNEKLHKPVQGNFYYE